MTAVRGIEGSTVMKVFINDSMISLEKGVYLFTDINRTGNILYTVYLYIYAQTH